MGADFSQSYECTIVWYVHYLDINAIILSNNSSQSYDTIEPSQLRSAAGDLIGNEQESEKMGALANTCMRRYKLTAHFTRR